MKHYILSILVLLFAAISSGCQTDVDIDSSDNGPRGALTSLTISLEESRISFGKKNGNSYPIYWSDGDKIVVNGVVSEEAIIDEENPACATFLWNTTLNLPYNITYPYCETTTANAPKVLFPDIQEYREGSFAQGSVPMCGYTSNSGDSNMLKHLAGVLRFPVIGKCKGVILKQIVITSDDGKKLSGEFAVNCATAEITACQNSKNSITYVLPDNFTLSTDKESVFYISIPYGDTGNCTVDFIEQSGDKMSSSWSNKSIKAGVVREFQTITYERGTSCSLKPLETEEDTLTIYYPTVYGYVKDTNGNPIEGVAVSNGFSVVATDAKGYYSMSITPDSWFIYISVPAEYEMPVNEFGQPCFYKPYPTDTPQYDFTLRPLIGGKQEKFALFTFADPQVSNSTAYKRFVNEAVSGVSVHCNKLKAEGIPCYGITLGDIISNSDSNNSGGYRVSMRNGFAVSRIGMPVFQVMGNHDNTFCNTSQPIFVDERSSTIELKAQRAHEEVFGPANYSFNRGNVHIIGMRDIIYTTGTSGAKYKKGFLPHQYEWIKQDLALVPKDHMVVLCVHIPLYNSSGNYIQEVLSLLDQFSEAHVISGHTHNHRNYNHKDSSSSIHKVYEHNCCALCGSWWSSNLAGDGTPNGYTVFIGEGNTFSDWYYMGYNKGMNTRSHQMRLYRGNAVTGGPISGSNTSNVKGYYAFNFADNVLLANVFNADNQWKIEVYEDGVYSGQMTLLTSSQPSFSKLIGDYTYENPRRAADGVVTGHDFYVTGHDIGVLNRYSSSKKSPSSGAYGACYHMYKYTLKNKNASIKVVATDRFGNQYTETNITEGTDYTLAKKP